MEILTLFLISEISRYFSQISDRNHLGQVFDKLLNQIGESEEFELPEWLNKGKPTPYIFIRRSILFCNCSFGFVSFCRFSFDQDLFWP